MASQRRSDVPRRSVRPWILAALLAAWAAVAVVALSGCGEDKAEAQTVHFTKAVDVGPDPFIDKPADRKGRKKVKLEPSGSTSVGAGPFGGTGSDLVCDRDLLIRSLKARPDRLAEWARVLRVKPTIKAVGQYISKLHPVTLTRDTRVTNHTFVNGRAVAVQSILAAGTAVLVDDYGNPVVRCRCGNPLLKPIEYESAKCVACPANYTPPPTCEYTETTYRRRWYPDRYYSNATYDEVFVRRFRSPCYKAYPDPPRVTITDIYSPSLSPKVRQRPSPRPSPSPTRPAPAPSQPRTRNPAASFSPSSGPVCVPYTLSASGFAPNRQLTVVLVRPDGVREPYAITTDAGGSGSYTFSPGPDCARHVQGTYTATVSDDSTGESADAAVSVSGGGDTSGGSDDTGDLQCDPPRSQLESEQCAAAGRP